MNQVSATSEATCYPDTHHHHVEKALVLDLRFEILHPSALGEQASTDPRVGEMVTAIRTF